MDSNDNNEKGVAEISDNAPRNGSEADPANINFIECDSERQGSGLRFLRFVTFDA